MESRQLLEQIVDRCLDSDTVTVARVRMTGGGSKVLQIAEDNEDSTKAKARGCNIHSGVQEVF